MKRIRPILPLLALALIAIFARLLPGLRIIDDSFITFRYARNLLAGQGFSYNPGEMVLGTTTPLYTLVLVALGALTGGPQANFPFLAVLVNALADAGVCILLYKLGQRLLQPLTGLTVALVWAIAPYSVTFAIGGLETSLYIFLLTLTTWAYLEKHRRITALAAALAILTRPDAILLLGPLALDRIFRALRPGKTNLHASEPLRISEVLIALLPVLLWYGFAWLYFGSPFPHSVQAKLAAYRLPANEALVRLIQHYATPFLEQNTFTARWAVAIGIWFYPFLYLIGVRRLARTAPRLWGWLLYPWLYFFAFAIPNPLIFRWYLTPPLPAYFFVILSGLETVLTPLFKSPPFAWRRRIATALFLALPLFSMLTGWEISPDHGPNRPAPTMAWFKLELLYRQAAEKISPFLSTDSTLAAGDVGVLGYYTPAQILDTVGLNSAESLNYYPLDARYYVITYAIAPDLILDEKPDWIIFLEVYGRKSILQDERFLNQYTLYHKFETDIYDSEGLLIYRCNNCSSATTP